MLDFLQLKTFTAFSFIFGLLVLSFMAISILLQIYKIDDGNSSYKKYLGLLHIVGVFWLWFFLSLFNYLTTNSNYSKWGTRLAFGIAPFSFIGIFPILFNMGGVHKKLIDRLRKIERITLWILILLLLISVFDNNVVSGSIAHPNLGARDIPILGSHAIIFLFIILSILVLILYSIIYIYRNPTSVLVRARIKILGLTTLVVTGLIVIFNMILPIIFHHVDLIDYGILSSLLVVFGFYLALEDNWVYSISYLISKHVFIWIAGIILFVSVKFFEILMSHVFGWNITNFSDINADLFGILLGIIVAYISLTLIKYSETIGLALVYPSFLKFRRDFNRTIHKSIDEKVVPSEILKEILMLIVKFLKIQNACFTDLDSMLAHTYKICINDKQDLTLNYIKIPILKKRYLVLIGKDFFAPKEFVEFFLTKILTINSLINLDITSTTLKSINTQLARAVVTRTNKLEKKLEQVSHNFNSLKNEFSDCKRLFPSIFGNVLFNVKMSFDYLKIIENKIPDDYDLRFNITRLHEQLISIKGVLHKVVIFSDVVMNNKVYRQKFDIKAHLFKLLDAWQPQFDNKSIGIIRDLEPGKVLLPYDYDKIDFIFNTIIGYMLINLRHGYLQAVQRNDLGKVSFNFKAVGQPKETGYSPVMDEKLVSSMETSLMLMERIVKLHNGTFSYIFQNSILYDVTFNLSKL